MSSTVNLPAVLKRRIKALETHLPGATAGDPRALHRARVASRRLREILPLIGTAGSKTRTRVRRLTRWLGRVREMDVALDLVGSETFGGAVARPALTEVQRQLQAARETRREKMLRRLARLDPERLGRKLYALLDEIGQEDENLWRRALATRVARRAGTLRKAAAEAGVIYVPERLHGVRIAAKKLRYALEIAAELGVPDAAKHAATIRRTQVTLGTLQDRHLLSRHLHSMADNSASVTPALASLESGLEASCRALHAQFLSQRESLLAALAAVRQQIVPALAHPGRRRPLKAHTATATHGRTDRALPDSTRHRGRARRQLA